MFLSVGTADTVTRYTTGLPVRKGGSIVFVPPEHPAITERAGSLLGSGQGGGKSWGIWEEKLEECLGRRGGFTSNCTHWILSLIFGPSCRSDLSQLHSWRRFEENHRLSGDLCRGKGNIFSLTSCRPSYCPATIASMAQLHASAWFGIGLGS